MLEQWKKAQEWLIDDEDKHLMNGYSWRINSNGYVCRNPKMRNYKYEKIERYLHRLVVGARKGEIVDHINGSRLDNRECNLRIVTGSQNNLHRKVKNEHGMAGIRKVGKKFRAYIGENNRQKHLGYFDSLAEAKNARRVAYDSRF